MLPGKLPTPSSGECGFAADFVSGLLDPGHPSPKAVTGPNGKTAEQRYNVYRNNVTISLVNALAATFPATLRITGEDFFRAMARSHVRATPPTSKLLFEYGHGFPGFIETYEHARSLPWLADVARIERAWLDAYHAPDAEPVAPDALTSVRPDRLADLVLVPHPATQIVRSRFPAVSIFAANRQNGLVGRITAGDPEDALVTRPALEVVVRCLPPGGAVFLTQLIAGEPLGFAAAAAIAASPDFDLPANIAGMLAAGVFCGIAEGEQP